MGASHCNQGSWRYKKCRIHLAGIGYRQWNCLLRGLTPRTIYNTAHTENLSGNVVMWPSSLTLWICMHRVTHVNAYVMYRQESIHPSTCIHTCIHMYTYVHTHIHTYIHNVHTHTYIALFCSNIKCLLWTYLEL